MSCECELAAGYVCIPCRASVEPRCPECGRTELCAACEFVQRTELRASLDIRTDYVHPPIPDRSCDWAAWDDNTYDGAPDSGRIAHIVGRGRTEAEAIADCIEQHWEAT